MRNKLVYFSRVKNLSSGLNQLLESIFCLLRAVQVLSLQEVVQSSEEVVVSWTEVR